MNDKIMEAFREAAGAAQVLTDEPMKNHTTFRIGGPADVLIMPESEEALQRCILICRENRLDWHLIGNGSNLLIGDKGVRGVVIRCDRAFSAVKVDGCCIDAQAGAMLSQIARTARNSSLSGMEFAAGIPGTLGGAMCMNAGAYGGEMKDITESVRVLDPRENRIFTLSGKEMEFGYRRSIVTEKNLTVLGARLRLEPGDAETISRRMEELREKRVSRQPLDKPSAGSTFKRPEGYFAGKLIMDAGLAGKRAGGAAVSEKHCGFIINEADASAADVRELISLVQDEVKRQFGVLLEPEVRMLGEF